MNIRVRVSDLKAARKLMNNISGPRLFRLLVLGWKSLPPERQREVVASQACVEVVPHDGKGEG